MAKSDNLAYMVRSLSKSEKRYFRLIAGMHEGQKEYVKLFDLLEREDGTIDEVKEKFKKQNNGVSFEMAGKQLYKVLMKTFLLFEQEGSVENTIMQAIREAKILFDRQIYEECFKVLRKARALAGKHENNLYLLLILKLEMQFLVRLDFIEVSEKELIERQKKIEASLKNEMYIHNHSSLYELLQLRALEQGEARSKEEQEKLNDLVMGEMQIYSIPKYDSFEANKLHLLFQSAYFSVTGDNKSSLKNFYELDKLFDEHRNIWPDPPVYYIQHLQGVLHNLRKMKKYDEMPYFLEKLDGINTKSAGTRQTIQQIIYRYRVSTEIDKRNYCEALQIKKEFEITAHGKAGTFSPHFEARMEMYNALIFFGLKNYKSAIKHLNLILNKGKIYKNLPVYKTIRLISLLVHFDRYKFDYIDYELRSFQRQLAKREKIFQIEKVLFSFMKKYMNTLSKSKHAQLIKEAVENLESLSQDRYESQILNEFDFIGWLKEKLSN